MKKCASILVITLALAITANAAVQPSAKELSVFGGYTHSDLKRAAPMSIGESSLSPSMGSDDAGTAGIGVSQFISNEVSVGLQVMGNWGDDVRLFDAGVNAKYHLNPMEQVIPYVGGQANYAHASGHENSDGLMWGPLAGVRYSMAEKTSIFAEYQYQLYSGGIRDTLEKGNAVLVGFIFGF